MVKLPRYTILMLVELGSLLQEESLNQSRQDRRPVRVTVRRLSSSMRPISGSSRTMGTSWLLSYAVTSVNSVGVVWKLQTLPLRVKNPSRSYLYRRQKRVDPAFFSTIVQRTWLRLQRSTNTRILRNRMPNARCVDKLFDMLTEILA